LFYGPLFLSSAVTITNATVRTGTAATTYTISGTASGVLTPIVNVSVSTFGISSDALTNDVTVTAGASASPTGVAATGAVTAPTVYLLLNVYLLGVSSSAFVGTVTASAKANAYPTGLSAYGYVGQVLVWGRVVPVQNPNFVDIVPSSSTEYTEIIPAQNPIWSPILA
jgi:hypothetical protein